MAKTITAHVEDMVGTAIPNGSGQYLQVRDPAGDIENYQRWLEFDADNVAWRLAHPGEVDLTPVPHAAAADPAAPTLPERLFIQARFMVAYSDGTVKSEPAQWAQINTTNFPGVDVAMYRSLAKALFDAQRAFEGLVPPV